MRKGLAVSLLLICGIAANALADDRAVYLLHCGGCHLLDGRGNPPEVPTLQNELGKIIRVPGGRDYLVQVPGASQAPVTDSQLADIINWILTEFNAATLQSSFVPLSADEVGKARRQTLADPLKRRAEIWQKYADASY